MPAKASKLCKRRGCKNERPPLSVQHNDPYCSSACCRLDHGLELPPSRERSDDD